VFLVAGADAGAGDSLAGSFSATWIAKSAESQWNHEDCFKKTIGSSISKKSTGSSALLDVGPLLRRGVRLIVAWSRQSAPVPPYGSKESQTFASEAAKRKRAADQAHREEKGGIVNKHR
jgi:hypothetical protein